MFALFDVCFINDANAVLCELLGSVILDISGIRRQNLLGFVDDSNLGLVHQLWKFRLDIIFDELCKFTSELTGSGSSTNDDKVEESRSFFFIHFWVRGDLEAVNESISNSLGIGKRLQEVNMVVLIDNWILADSLSLEDTVCHSTSDDQMIIFLLKVQSAIVVWAHWSTLDLIVFKINLLSQSLTVL